MGSGASKKADTYPRSISDWPSLASVIGHFSEFSGHGWLFRGVSDESFEPIPKVGRPRKKLTKAPRIIPYTLEDEVAVFDAFKQHARAFIPGSHTQLEWLAIAQHFGVPTRLLDWSESVLVAAWFAVQQPEHDGVDAAIWVTRGERAVPNDFNADPASLLEPHIYRPPHITPRMSAQGSVLMVCPTPDCPATLAVPGKIIVKGKMRFQLRKRLNACGINASTLFGDLAGVGQHLAWVFENEWLAQHRRSGSFGP